MRSAKRVQATAGATEEMRWHLDWDGPLCGVDARRPDWRATPDESKVTCKRCLFILASLRKRYAVRAGV